MDLSSMTYAELFKLNRMIEREMSFRAEPLFIIMAIIAIVAVVIWARRQ